MEFPFSNPQENSNLINLTSENEFFEFFLNKLKCEKILIPDTILFKDGIIHSWLFNSKNNKAIKILQKKKENSIISEVINKFSENNDKKILESIAIIKLQNKKIFVNINELDNYLNNYSVRTIIEFFFNFIKIKIGKNLLYSKFDKNHKK